MKKLIAFVTLLVFTLCNSGVAFAADQLWDKGRYHTYYVDGKSMGGSAGVISVSSYYTKTGEWGMNRVRVWSRVPLVDTYFNSFFNANGSTWVANAYITNEPVSSYPSAYNIYNWDPQSSGGSTSFLGAIAYDILGYKGGGTTIQAIVNYLNTTVAVTGSTISKTIEFRNPDQARDLPAGVYYDDADGSVNGQTSSYQSKFWFNLPVASTNFNMAARGKLNYKYRFWDVYVGTYQTYTLPTSTFSHGFYINS